MTRYIMVGGFLGAGKTTAMLQFGQHLAGKGLRVGLVTNDQSSGLVDTTMLSARLLLLPFHVADGRRRAADGPHHT
jgi:G3E family GTPase